MLSESGTNLPCFPPCANEDNTDDLWGLRSVPQPCVHGESQTSKCHQNYPSPLTSSLERNIGWPLSMEIRTHSLKADSASLEFLPVVAAELQATHQTALRCVPRSACCTLLEHCRGWNCCAAQQCIYRQRQEEGSAAIAHQRCSTIGHI